MRHDDAMTRLGAPANPISHRNVTTRSVKARVDLRAFLDADADAAGLDGPSRFLSPTYRFQWLLRHAELLSNPSNGVTRAVGLLVSRVVTNCSSRLGFTIPLNTTGPGLCLAHWGRWSYTQTHGSEQPAASMSMS